MNRKIFKVALGVSVIGSIGFAVLLGLGCNGTVKTSTEIPYVGTAELITGVGSQNYAQTWINGKKSDTVLNITYEDYINDVKYAYEIEGTSLDNDIYKGVRKSYKMMVSGAVLFSIFATTLIASGILLIVIKPIKIKWVIKSEIQNESFNDRFYNFLSSKGAISNKYTSEADGITSITFITKYIDYDNNESLIKEFFDLNHDDWELLLRKDEIKLVSENSKLASEKSKQSKSLNNSVSFNKTSLTWWSVMWLFGGAVAGAAIAAGTTYGIISNKSNDKNSESNNGSSNSGSNNVAKNWIMKQNIPIYINDIRYDFESGYVTLPNGTFEKLFEDTFTDSNKKESITGYCFRYYSSNRPFEEKFYLFQGKDVYRVSNTGYEYNPKYSFEKIGTVNINKSNEKTIGIVKNF